jgi:hypothetical protein
MIRLPIFSCCFVASAALAAPAGPVPISLYGVRLGAPLSLPECPLSEQQEMCYQRLDTLTPVSSGHHEVSVYFASGGMPSISSSRRFTVTLMDGAVEQITISTRGLSAQSEAMLQLSQKFGKPTLADVSKVQNNFGAQYEKVTAVWRIGPDWVRFFGMSDRLDEGIIIAITGAAQARFDKSHPPEPKL